MSVLVRRLGRGACSSLLAVVALLLCACPVGATIRYSISLAQPERHVFHVQMEIPSVQGAVTVRMPAWNALYQIRDFSHHVMNLRASDSTQARALPAEKIDKQTWRIAGEGAVLLVYETYWDEPGPFSSQLNSEHAFLNLATVLLYIKERRSEDVSLELRDLPAGWRVASALHPASDGGLRFISRSYDALVDAPIEAGTFEEFALPGMEPRIRVVIHGDNWKRETIVETLKRICAYEISLMGGAPFEEFTFFYHIGSVAARSGGGMEHANSTAIAVRSGDAVAGVSAHELFHAWNVKRIRPQSLEPVDYAREQWTRALWFAEGVTNTYGSYTLLRSGLWSKAQFYADLSDQITELESRPANHWKSAEEASLDAWLEKYPLYNQPDLSISYYTKGQVLGVLLDVLIRDATGNRACLDDVMRALNEEFARKGRFYHDSEDIRAVAEKIAARSLEEFFRRYVAGAEPLPYNETLLLAGLELHAFEHRRAVLGFAAASGPGGEMVVAAVEPDGPAERAGLKEGDVILQWNGGEPPRRIERWLRDRRPGESVRVRIRRGGEHIDTDLVLGERVETFWQVSELSHPTGKQKSIREGLLHGTTTGSTARR